MIYACNQLLRSLRATDLEFLAEQKAEDAAGQEILIDLARPNRRPRLEHDGYSHQPIMIGTRSMARPYIRDGAVAHLQDR